MEQSAVNHEGIFFPIYSLLKCSKQNRPVQVVKCIKFDEPALDVCDYTLAYMQRTLKFRIRAVNKGLPKPRNLFLSYSSKKPLRRATISKYILEVLSLAGIDTSTFRGHSTRGSMPSVMARRGSSPAQILRQGNWSNLGVFQKYYNRYSEDSIEGKLIQQVMGKKRN